MLATFQGPFSIHAVLARALKVPGNRLRLRTPPEFGRQLRREAGHLSLHPADGDRGARRGTPGEMDRGPARASHRVGVGHEPSDHARSRRRGRRARHRACLGPGGGRRRAYPRAGARHALPHARQPHRRVRHSQRLGAQPRGDDQQDADGTEPRLRRAAGLLRAGAADASHRGRAEARSARRDPPQSRAERRISVSAPRPAACSTRATTRHALRRRSRRAALRICASGRRRRARRVASTASA